MNAKTDNLVLKSDNWLVYILLFEKRRPLMLEIFRFYIEIVVK
jgi:hypothetical protein